jgi:hypothetical protein
VFYIALTTFKTLLSAAAAWLLLHKNGEALSVDSAQGFFFFFS